MLAGWSPPRRSPAIEIFAACSERRCERMARAAADITLAAGEYAAHEGDERALFAVLDGPDRAGQARRRDRARRRRAPPGDIFGEVPIALGTVFPVGFRAAEPSRLHAHRAARLPRLASVAPDVAKEIGRLAAAPDERLARAAGHRRRPAAAARDRRRPPLGRRLHRAAALPRPQPDHLQVATPDAPDAERACGAGPLPTDADLPTIRVIDGKTVVRPQPAPGRRAARHRHRGRGRRVRHADRRRRARPASRPRCTAPPRGCARSSSSARRPAARPAPRRGSRTTSASRPASRATSSPAARCSRRAGSAPRSS